MAGVVVDSGQETVDGFLPRLIIAKCRLIEAGEGVVGEGVVGDGGRIEPQFFILFYWGSAHFAFFPRLIFVSGFIFKVIVFLGIQLWVVEQTCKTGK